MLERLLIVLLVIGAIPILIVASYETNSRGLPSQLRQTDDDLEAYKEFITLPLEGWLLDS